MRIPFNGPAYKLASVNQSGQRCVNWYLESVEQGGKTQSSLIPTPGTLLRKTVGVGPIRGVLAFGSYMYVVSASEIYRVDQTYSATLIGSLTTSAGPVCMACNGLQVCIVDGAIGHIVTIATAVTTQITADGFPNGATFVRFADGYFIAGGDGSKQWHISGINDGATWNALDYASAEGGPAPLVAAEIDHREVWLFSADHIEIWYNTGNGSFPYQRSGNAFLEQGCAAVGSVAKLDNSIFWLGKDARGDGMIWRANGYQPARISDHGIEHALLGYGRIDDAIAFTYQQSGHSFYVISFPSADATWVYDCATQCWHERAWFNSLTGDYHRHRGAVFAVFGRDHIVGDWQNGNLYALDQDTYTDISATAGPYECLHPLTDPGALAASFGYGHLPTISPKFQSISYTQTEGVQTRIAVEAEALASAANAVSTVNKQFEFLFSTFPSGDFPELFGCGVVSSHSGVVVGSSTFGIRRVSGQLQVVATGGIVVNALSATPIVTVYFLPSGAVGWMLDGVDQGTPYSLNPTDKWAPYIFVNDGLSVGNLCAGALITSSADQVYKSSLTATDICGNLIGSTTFAYAASPIRRLRATQSQDSQNVRIFYQFIEIDAETGVGLNDGQGSDPKLMLRWSDDGGHRWSKTKHMSLGKIGKYGTRVRREQLGAGRNRVWEISVTDPVKVIIMGAMAGAKAGSA